MYRVWLLVVVLTGTVKQSLVYFCSVRSDGRLLWSVRFRNALWALSFQGLTTAPTQQLLVSCQLLKEPRPLTLVDCLLASQQDLSKHRQPAVCKCQQHGQMVTSTDC